MIYYKVLLFLLSHTMEGEAGSLNLRKITVAQIVFLFVTST